MLPLEPINAQETFPRMMGRVISKFGNVHCYVDDVIISSENEDYRIIHLDENFRSVEEKVFVSEHRTAHLSNQDSACLTK